MSKKKNPKKTKRRQQGDSTTHEAVVSRVNIHDEVLYVCDLANRGETRVVGLHTLVFFSTCNRDAWMLDWEDELAMCLVKEGIPQPAEFGETDQRFAIRWQGHYQIEDDLFIYIDDLNEGRSAVIQGYPVKAIADTIERLWQHLRSS